MALTDWYLNGTRLDPNNFSFEESKETIGEFSRTLSGAGRRDIRARKLNLSLAWEFLPETSFGTYHAYTDLKALGTKGTMTFIRPTGTSGTTQHTVFCSDPEGELAFRSTGTVFWNVSMEVYEA